MMGVLGVTPRVLSKLGEKEVASTVKDEVKSSRTRCLQPVVVADERNNVRPMVPRKMRNPFIPLDGTLCTKWSKDGEWASSSSLNSIEHRLVGRTSSRCQRDDSSVVDDASHKK